MMPSRWRKTRFGLCAAFLAALILTLAQGPSPAGAEAGDSLIEAAGSRQTGDLPEIEARRRLRVLVNYSPSNFFYEDGEARGFECELMKAFEAFVNRGVKHKRNWTQVVFIPVRFDQLLAGVVEGRGDVAAAGLTITRERLRLVDFTRPYISDIAEVVVAGKSAPDVADLAGLRGKTVFVRSDSSYAAHLKAFNEAPAPWFSRDIRIRQMDPLLVTEDLLEMVNAGLIDFTVADDHIAHAWARVLPDIRVRDDLAIHHGGAIAWAVRKDSPRLLSSLNAFIDKHKKGTELGNIIYRRYFENSRWIKNPAAGAGQSKLNGLLPLFEKYGRQYGFDPLILASLAYQESGFDNRKKSPRGAVGVMQLLPATAADKNIGIADIADAENNIHAAAKYLDFLRRRYFSEPAVGASDRVFFSLAAYNAGPARIAQMRRIAATRELDPNRWFFNVEVIAAEKIGRETVTYVTNISKYFIAYKLQSELQDARMKAVDAIREEKR